MQAKLQQHKPAKSKKMNTQTESESQDIASAKKAH